MKAFLAAGAAVAVIGFGNVATAADMPLKAPVSVIDNWTGFYVGANAGVLIGRNTATWTPYPTAALFGADPYSGGINKTSFVGGVHGGYNWLVGRSLLLGVEADWSWTKNSGSTSNTPWTFGGAVFAPLSSTTMSRDLNWLATLRARVGTLISPDMLLYVTGGAAWGGFSYNAVATNGVGYVATSSSSKTASGYVVGGGLEWAWTRNWMVRGEYLFYGLNSSQSILAAAAGLPANPSGFSWDNAKIHVLRAGLTYKF